MIRELEKLTGNTLDEDRLRDFCRFGNQTVDYILKIRELKKQRPCPDPGWHRPADTIFMTQNRHAVRNRLLQNALRNDKGTGGTPVWESSLKASRNEDSRGDTLGQAYDLPFFEWLEETHGATYSLDTLTYLAPEVGLVDTTNMETMIEGLAWRLLHMPMGRQTMGFSDIWINDFVRIAKEFKVDAFMIGGHMACKHFWALNKLLTDKVQRRSGYSRSPIRDGHVRQEVHTSRRAQTHHGRVLRNHVIAVVTCTHMFTQIQVTKTE